LTRFVLDASVTLCWFFADQATSYSDAILDRLAAKEEATTPALWPLEVANALVVAERRKLIKTAQTAGFLEQLGHLPIRVEPAASEHTFGAILETARQHRLSVYDACYLDLAMKEALPLATMDAALRVAARAAGVAVA
jgi:predicted nucleic acid-binding protein